MHSRGFKINVNKNSSDEGIYSLIKITHPFLNKPICIINDSKNFDFQDETYVAMPFQIKRQDDIQGELPKVVLTVSNVGRSMIKWIDASNGGMNGIVTVFLVRRSSQFEEEKIVLGINSIIVTTETLSFNLVIQNNLIKRSMRYLYDLKKSRGLF